MRVNPDSGELFWMSSCIGLLVKELGNSIVFKRHSHWGTMLADHHEVLHKQQVVRIRDPKSADLSWSEIAQIQEFGPRPRAKSQTLPRCSKSLQACSPAARLMVFHGRNSRTIR
jgi:hypothetical protein